jgi:hypothetical protein
VGPSRPLCLDLGVFGQVPAHRVPQTAGSVAVDYTDGDQTEAHGVVQEPIEARERIGDPRSDEPQLGGWFTLGHRRGHACSGRRLRGTLGAPASNQQVSELNAD